MTIGIDVEGTISVASDFFAWLTGALARDGHRVFVITMRTDRETTACELEQMGIRYVELLMPDPDVFGRPDPERWKGEVCAHLGIDVMFDDSADILEHMPRFTARFRSMP